MPTNKQDRDAQDLSDLLDEADDCVNEGEFERAKEHCARALALATDPVSIAEVLMVRIEAEGALDESGEDALRTLEELRKLEIDDVDFHVSVGNVALTLGEAETAQKAYAEALQRDDEQADAHYGLGVLHLQREERAPMLERWLKVLDLDAVQPPPDWHLDRAELETIVDEVLAELPKELLDRLGNVPILIEDQPSREIVEDGCDPRILGLFAGQPVTAEESSIPNLTTIHIYQRNLEGVCEDREQLEDELRITVLHETAHFFGLDEDDVEAMGIG